jgi:3-carboxy-cis,cis-muconate cycloisomerase
MHSRLVGSLGTTEELADIFSDRSVLAALLRFESALACAQARLGIIPECVAGTISRAAVPEAFDANAIFRQARVSASVAVPLVEMLSARVTAMDEVAGRFVHWGATSQDAVDTATSLLLGRARTILARDQERLARSLRDLSEEHGETIMLGRTLLQPAPPITFGYKVAGWYGGIQRSWRRLNASFNQAVTLQFGGAVGTLAAYGDKGMTLAAELGKELNLLVPTAPSHAHRDRLAALVTDCGIYTAALGKVARDVSLLMQHEVGEVSETGGGSSAMPHKLNPAGSAVALAAATRMPGLVAAFLAGMIDEHERAVGGWQAGWPTIAEVVETTGSALAAIADVISGLIVCPDRMRVNLERTYGTIFAEKARMLLQPKMGREASTQLLSSAAREAVEKKRPFREVLEERSEIGTLLTTEQLNSIDRPEDYLGMAECFRRKLLEE